MEAGYGSMKWILLFWCAVAWGQLPVVQLPQLSPSSSTTPQTLGANYWWVAKDLTNNAHVTNWTDRIRGSVWSSTSTTYPSNLSDGVHFSSVANKALTNNAAPLCTISANSTTWLIMEFTNTSPFQAILAADVIGSAGQLMDFQSSLKPDLAVNALTHIASSGAPTSVFFDICWVGDTTSNSLKVYTNGILETTFAGGALNNNTNWMLMGSAYVNGDVYSGVVKEMAVWATNAESSTAIGNLHTYGTNTYGYSP